MPETMRSSQALQRVYHGCLVVSIPHKLTESEVGWETDDDGEFIRDGKNQPIPRYQGDGWDHAIYSMKDKTIGDEIGRAGSLAEAIQVCKTNGRKPEVGDGD